MRHFLHWLLRNSEETKVFLVAHKAQSDPVPAPSLPSSPLSVSLAQATLAQWPPWSSWELPRSFLPQDLCIRYCLCLELSHPVYPHGPLPLFSPVSAQMSPQPRAPHPFTLYNRPSVFQTGHPFSPVFFFIALILSHIFLWAWVFCLFLFSFLPLCRNVNSLKTRICVQFDHSYRPSVWLIVAAHFLLKMSTFESLLWETRGRIIVTTLREHILWPKLYLD